MAAIKNTAVPTPLTERMRMSTKKVHDKSDRMVNIKLALALTSRHLYGEALGLFAPIYDTIETILEQHRGDGKRLQPLAALLVEFKRSPGFNEDIFFYLGEDGARELRDRRPPQELQEYLDHLNKIAEEDPVRLVAYVYHMYMAILAGGYMIRKLVKRTMGLKDDRGVNALSFDPDVDTRDLRRRMKLCVDEGLGFNEKEQAAILEESGEVFRRNNEVVSTVKDSASFSRVFTKWMWGLGAVCAIVPAVAVTFFLVQGKSIKRS